MSIIIERGKMGQLLLSFDYDEEIIRKVKTIKGRKWNLVEKKWILNDNMSTVNRIYKLFPHSAIIDCRQNKDSRVEVSKNNETINMLQNKLRLRGYSSKQ